MSTRSPRHIEYAATRASITPSGILSLFGGGGGRPGWLLGDDLPAMHFYPADGSGQMACGIVISGTTVPDDRALESAPRCEDCTRVNAAGEGRAA